MALTPEVEEALVELSASFAEATITYHEDGSGGAFVRVSSLPLGDGYSMAASWVGFHLTVSYPEAQVYPHYCEPGLTRRDGTPLQPEDGFQQTQWAPEGDTGPREDVTQISRSSNRWDASRDTATTKLHSVLSWLRS